MKTTTTLFAILFLGLNTLFAQGEKPKILTLSNGLYPEFHTYDSLMRVGSVIVNTYTGKIDRTLDYDSLYNESNLEPTVISRFYSLDPHASRYPYLTPYAFVGNMPTIATDPDGRDIVIRGSQANQDAFVAKLNKEVGSNMFKHEKGKLTLVNNATEMKGVFLETLKTTMNDTKVVPIYAIKTDSPEKIVYFDEFSDGAYDLGDFDKLSGDVFKSTLLHVVVERFETIDYDAKVKKSRSGIVDAFTDDDYPVAHKKALNKEADFMKDLYPELKENISYQGEGNLYNDMYKHVYDFGAVFKQYTVTDQPGRTGIEDIGDPRSVEKNGNIIAPKTEPIKYLGEDGE